MNKSEQPVFLARWLRITVQSIWSKTAMIIFVLTFALAEIIWWRLFGFKKASEQALENIIPVLAGVFITVVVITTIKFFEVRTLIRGEDNKLSLVIAQQADEAKRISVWLSW